MTTLPNDQILTLLRRIDAKLDLLADDLDDIKVRTGTLARLQEILARRFSEIDSRLKRIERRLDLVDAI